jgi:hypothetical protein
MRRAASRARAGRPAAAAFLLRALSAALTLSLALAGLSPAAEAEPPSQSAAKTAAPTKAHAAPATHAKARPAPATRTTPAAPTSPARPGPTTPVTATAHPAPMVPAVPSAPQDSLRAPADTPKPLRTLNQQALKVPEKLLFDVIWGGWSFRWVTAGQATLELLPTDTPAVWKIRSLAWCNGFFQTFYPVRDTVESHIDSRGIYPIRFEKHLHEGGYKASISATYDQARHTVTTQDTSFSIEPFTHDVLSAFYYIRTQHLEVGDTLQLAAVSGKKKYGLKVLCHRRETIEVPAGTFKTLVVEPVLKEDGLFKAKGKLTIWVTDDEAHIPVKMQSKIPVGSIKAELVSKS